jgi:hypothetical protein
LGSNEFPVFEVARVNESQHRIAEKPKIAAAAFEDAERVNTKLSLCCVAVVGLF